MSVRTKLLALILLVALIPLGVSGAMGLGVHHRAVEQKVSELHLRLARNSASRSQAWVDEHRRALTLLARDTITWGELNEAERQGAVWLIYRQFELAAVVSLLDARGSAIAPGAYRSPNEDLPGLESHPLATPATLRSFAERVPLQQTLKDGFAIGETFATEHGASLIPFGLRVPASTSGQHWVVAMAVSPRALCESLDEGTEEVRVVLADAAGRDLCVPSTAAEPARPRWLNRAADESGLIRFRDADGLEMLAAVSTLDSGWNVAVLQSVERAFTASRRLRWQTIFWLTLAALAAIGSGLVMSGSINRVVRRLADGARQLARGNFEHRLRLTQTDELGRLGAAFDRMADEIAARDAEIREWNEELQRRVDERTRELALAQEQLLESQKMAAVSTLAAGAAHEINNPLAGVLGVVQLLAARARKDPSRAKDTKLLDKAEQDAHRMRAIITQLQQLGEERQELRPIAVAELVKLALGPLHERIEQANAKVEQAIDEGVPEVLGSLAELRQALMHVLDNAIKASPESVVVRATLVEKTLVKITVTDQGPGIPEENLGKVFEPFFTTKEQWEGQGLGLAIAFRVIHAHHGTIRVESTVGEGTTVVITLPVARKGAHLE